MKHKISFIFLCTAMCACFFSCSKQNGSFDDDDLVGVVTFNMRNKSNGKTKLWADEAYPYRGCGITLDDGNNFEIISDGNGGEGYGSGDIIDMGKKKLSQINEIPSSGWRNMTAATPKHGYLFRFQTNDTRYSEVPEYGYYKIYVTDYITGTSGGILGVSFKYCLFEQ